MPLVFTRHRVQRDHGIGEEVGARPIATPIVRGGAAERHVYDAAFIIHGHVPTPDVHAGAALPAISEPSIVPFLARARHGMKFPQWGAGARIVSARIARRTFGHFAHGGADHRDIFINGGNARVRHHHVDLAFIAESRIDLARVGVQRDQFAARGKQDARRILLVARPVGDAALGCGSGRQLISPNFGAGHWIECQYAAACRQVHHTVDHNRRGGRRCHTRAGQCERIVGSRGATSARRLGWKREGPGWHQFGDVAGRDLIERRVLGACQVARVVRPVGGSNLGGQRRGANGQEQNPTGIHETCSISVWPRPFDRGQPEKHVA